MSACVGAVLVAKPEDLFHYLPNRRQRIELPALHRVEDPLELGVALDGTLEVSLRPARRYGEHLTREMLPPPFLEQAVRLEVRAVFRDLLPQRVDVLA